MQLVNVTVLESSNAIKKYAFFIRVIIKGFRNIFRILKSIFAPLCAIFCAKRIYFVCLIAPFLRHKHIVNANSLSACELKMNSRPKFEKKTRENTAENQKIQENFVRKYSILDSIYAIG